MIQHVKLGWHQNELFIEVHPDGEQLDQLEYEKTYDTRPVEGVDQQIVDAAGLNAYRLDWPVIRAALRERRGIPTRITLDLPATPYAPPAPITPASL